MNEAVVMVSRRWKAGQMIRIEVKRYPEGDNGVEVSMSLDEFVSALAQETGNPAMLMTENGLLKALRAAADKVVAGMKAETARAM